MSILSPHSFKLFNRKLSNSEVQSSFSVFHNNVVSINQNLENSTLLLDELDFQFGVTETKITNENGSFSCIPGYIFDFLPTPLASWGVGLFIHESLNYTVLENVSNEAFQALWIEVSFANNKNIVCGIIYRQHNSPDQFMECILVNHATDPDKLFSTFYKKFNKILNKHAPITKLSKRLALV